MNQSKLEGIVGTLLIFPNGRIMEDPRAQPGMTVRSVGGLIGPIQITKIVYGAWKHLIEGAPSFTDDGNIQEVISDVGREIKQGDEYLIRISYNGRDRTVRTKVVTQFMLNPNTITYLRIIDDGDLNGYLCAASTRELIEAKH